MRKIPLIFAILLLVSQFTEAQTVTLSTTTANPTRGTLYFNNTTKQLQYWNGTAWLSITNTASSTGWALNGTNLHTTNTGYVGIGTTLPTKALTVKASDIGISQESPDGTIKIGFFTSNSSAYLQTHSDDDLKFSTNNGTAKMVLQKVTGNVGIGTSNPDNKLQIGEKGSTVFAGNDIVFGNGTNATALYQSNTSASIASSTDIVLRPRFPSGGYVGINTPAPANFLQIGSMGSTGYAGNDIAFGNGTNVTGISQSNAALSIVSTTDILLKANNANTVVGIGGGRVGINTLTPRGPLDVGSWSNTATIPFAYFRRDDGDGHAIVNSTSGGVASVSIYAERSILSTQFVAYSDARIKNIVGISNSAQDLATIMVLQITDYTMKDQIQHGNKAFKKVIAQQVEKVYPQAVSQITDIVPDIYTLAENVVYQETLKTLTCSLSKNYDIKVGEKLQFIHPTAGKIKAEVIEVAGNSFTVKDWQHPTDKIFVYGREVNDFRSVDYEALSMLGISAIQQLAKENDEMKAQNKELSRKLEQLKSDFSARLEALEAQLPKTLTGN